ncbi:MAG: WYL domain-containing protein, partial [Chloracidobacterium sp.]
MDSERQANNCFNGIHGAPVTVRLRTFGVTARMFTERTFHLTQRVIEYSPKTAQQDESVTIEMTRRWRAGLERFVLGWLPEIEVLPPDSLREKPSVLPALACDDERALPAGSPEKVGHPYIVPRTSPNRKPTSRMANPQPHGNPYPKSSSR